MSRRILMLLGILAAICLLVLVGIFVTADWNELGGSAERIWENTLDDGARTAAGLPH